MCKLVLNQAGTGAQPKAGDASRRRWRGRSASAPPPSKLANLYVPPDSPDLNMIERVMFHSRPRKVTHFGKLARGVVGR